MGDFEDLDDEEVDGDQVSQLEEEIGGVSGQVREAPSRAFCLRDGLFDKGL